MMFRTCILIVVASLLPIAAATAQTASKPKSDVDKGVDETNYEDWLAEQGETA